MEYTLNLQKDLRKFPIYTGYRPTRYTYMCIISFAETMKVFHLRSDSVIGKFYFHRFCSILIYNNCVLVTTLFVLTQPKNRLAFLWHHFLKHPAFLYRIIENANWFPGTWIRIEANFNHLRIKMSPWMPQKIASLD